MADFEQENYNDLETNLPLEEGGNLNLQLNLNEPLSNMKTVDGVAVDLQVSASSVRNWIKAGYLKTQNGCHITLSSYEIFIKSIIGKEKLTKRANKSNFDKHDHDAVQIEFLNHAKRLDSNDLDNLGSIYENTLSNSHRNKEGIYYTPQKIVERFFEFIEGDVSSLTFCDPCCGSGNFVMAALKRGFLPENIYGFDTDPVAIEITKARLKSNSNIEPPNIHKANFLQDIVLDQMINVPPLNVVLTNPPWGKKIENIEKVRLSKAFDCPKSTDTSALFVQATLRIAAPSAIIGMLLPESFFNISTFSTTRKIVSTQKILGFIDLGKPFKGLITKAKGIILQKENFDDAESILCEALSGTHFRSQSSFKNNPKYIFNFECTDRDSDIIKYVYEKPHLTLKGNAQWGLGIVTGNNKKFIKSLPDDGYIPVFKGSEIRNGALPEPKSFIPSDLSQYQQVASMDLYFQPEKIIYRFISSRLVFHHDTNRTFFLNSANMLVLYSDFGISHKNLVWLLNTHLLNWIFRKIFNTHKVLRGDIEFLPIFHGFFDGTQDNTEENLLEYLNIEVDTDGTYRIKK